MHFDRIFNILFNFSQLKRDFVMSVSSRDFYCTGLFPDIVQVFSILIFFLSQNVLNYLDGIFSAWFTSDSCMCSCTFPVVSTSIRAGTHSLYLQGSFSFFTFSGEKNEWKYIIYFCKYISRSNVGESHSHIFQNRSLLELALTHPSYRTNYGTNSDHARNTLNNCGVRSSKQRLHDRLVQQQLSAKKRGTCILIIVENFHFRLLIIFVSCELNYGCTTCRFS